MTRRLNLAEEYQAERAEQALKVLRGYDVTLVSAVYWHEDSAWHVEERELNDILLLVPVKGALTATLDGQDLEVTTGSVLIVPENTSHALRTSPGVKYLEQIAVHCYITSTWRPPLLPLFESPVQPLRHPCAWHDRLRQLVVATNSEGLEEYLGRLLIQELLAERILAGAALRPANPDIDPRVAHALKRIHRDYASDLTIVKLAGDAQLSTVQFRKLFQRHLHQSPKQYILNHRLKVAAQLLRSTSDTVQGIAYSTGFNSEAYFHRCFRRTHDCTPTEYRAGRTRAV